MLPYFRNYAFIAYILGVAVPVLLVTGLSWLFGFYIVSTLPGLLAAIIMLICGLLLAKKVVINLTDKKADEMLSLYNDSCDPRAFVDAAKNVAAEIRPPYDEVGSWFLSYYALALDDLGHRDEAVKIGQGMLSSAQRAVEPQTKAALMVNIEPLVERLFGADQALEVVMQAQQAIAGSTDPDDVNRLSFLSWEQGVLEAVRNGDSQTLVQRFSGVRNSSSYPMRIRVSYALLEASVHKSLNEIDKERECLSFVVANGNKLPAVGLAQERLNALR